MEECRKSTQAKILTRKGFASSESLSSKKGCSESMITTSKRIRGLNVVQEAVIKPIPKKKKCKKAKWLFDEALQIAEKRRETKGKRKQERYTHLIEQQGDIRKPSSVINAKKQRKTIEWQRQRSLQENQRYQGNISCKYKHNIGQK